MKENKKASSAASKIKGSSKNQKNVADKIKKQNKKVSVSKTKN
jgi:hypothetical protein